MILFKTIMESFTTEPIKLNSWYEDGEVPEPGEEDLDVAPELGPSVEDENYGESVEL
jgi:hypothetical protein